MHEKRCSGTIEIDVDTKEVVIEWYCIKCNEAGRISDWQGTKWDNTK